MSTYDYSDAPVGEATDEVVDTGHQASLYDSFRADLQKAPDVPETVDYNVRGRENFQVRVRVNDITLDKLETWRKRSRRPNSKSVDPREFAIKVLAAQTECLLFKGEPAEDKEGNLFTFNNQELWDLLGVYEYGSAITRFFATDADLLIVSNKIVDDAGYGDDDEDDNPLG